MAEVKRVAIAGAAGELGSHIFEALLRSGRYSLTVLTRSISQHSFLSGGSSAINVVEVDYESFDSLRGALENQDVLISVLGKAGISSQHRLIDAAVAARVKRIIPSEFGGDLKNIKSRQFPTYRPKVEVEERLEKHCSNSDTSYTFIFNNMLLDWGLREGLLLNPKNRTVRLYDGGRKIFSATTMATVGRAVVAVLDKYHTTSNRAVYIQDIAITQVELLEMAQELTKGDGGKEWVVIDVDTAQLELEAYSDLEKGLLSPQIFYSFAVRGGFAYGYGGHFQTLDNELLGIQQMERSQVRELVREAVRKVE